MEYVYTIGKEVLLIPAWALLLSPLIRLSARVSAASNISLKAALMLGLITGAAALVISIVLFPLHWAIGKSTAYALVLITDSAASAWLFGYFLRSSSGNSIGMGRGFIVYVLAQLMLLGIFMAIVVIYIGARIALR